MASIEASTISTADPAELGKFADLGAAWWATNGPMAPLHKFNPVRLAFIRDQACQHFGLDAATAKPLRDLRVLDVGCGGGLLAEPLARLGAQVIGIDPLASNVEAARAHAEAAGVRIDYRTEPVEALAGAAFDLVVASEVVEHLPEPAEFTDALAAVCRFGGVVVVTTLSRTLTSFAKAVVGAEYLVRWLPRGTHDWRRFITPAELGRLLRASGLRPFAIRGASYDGARDEFRLRRDTSVNYLLAAERR